MSQAWIIELKGVVVEGNRIGRRLGFRTANLVVGDDLPVGDGVYAGQTELQGGRTYPSVIYIGRKPSLEGGGKRVLEAHIAGFDGSLYGQAITVRVGKFLRPDQRFDSMEELAAQIEKDKQEALCI